MILGLRVGFFRAYEVESLGFWILGHRLLYCCVPRRSFGIWLVGAWRAFLVAQQPPEHGQSQVLLARQAQAVKRHKGHWATVRSLFANDNCHIGISGLRHPRFCIG